MRLRIFLASPSDVADERALAKNVIRDLLPYQKPFRGLVHLEVVAWDDTDCGVPLLATDTPQASIDRQRTPPAECDIVVGIFWSRLGTQLPHEWEKKSDGSPYRSGSEWECLSAIPAAKAYGKPVVLLYRRIEKASVAYDDPDRQKKIDQWDLVQAFFEEMKGPDGSLKAGVKEYASPEDFRRKLESDLREVIYSQFSLQTLIVVPTPPETPAINWPGEPYPGLRAFTSDESAIFFGRGDETDALVRRLADINCRFIALVGASGSGKSSLVAAGLLPRLAEGALPGSQDWIVFKFTPGELADKPLTANPFMALAASVQLEPLLLGLGIKRRDLAGQLMRDVRSLQDFAAQLFQGRSEAAKLLLVIDQFEELFTLVDPDLVKPFIALLAIATNTPRLHVVATLRADFYPHCLDFPYLADMLRDASFPLAAPGPRALGEMVERPAERAGLELEQGLVDRILGDSGHELGALALVAFVLAELYQQRTPDGRLTMDAYEALGGVAGAIGRRAEQAYTVVRKRLSEKKLAHAFTHLFRELVTVGEFTEAATRQRVALTRFKDAPAVKALASDLTDARLLVKSQGATAVPVVEVAHESLLRSWPRLSEWIELRKDDLRLLRRVRQAAEDWERRYGAAEYCCTDDRAVEVIGMIERLSLRPENLTSTERAFLGPIDRSCFQDELNNQATTHERRASIGVRLSLLGDSRAGVGLRADGLPDIAWCAVQGGQVSLKNDARMFTAEPLCVAKYPVTWRQYGAFLEASDGFGNPAWWEGLAYRPKKPGRQFYRRDNRPAANVCWFEAVAFCCWLSAHLGCTVRLPAEWEWQQAATGGDPGRKYPWGADWDVNHANTYESELNRITAVGVYPHGASPVGALDMSGNVWEWCINEYEDPERIQLSGDASRAVRGGTCNLDQLSAAAHYRSSSRPGARHGTIGFRLVCSCPIN